jgi:hypothetical protein
MIMAEMIMCWKARVRFPAVLDFSFLHSLQTDPGAHPAFYPMGVEGFFPVGLSAMALEADHLPRSSAEVKKGRAITPLPHMSSWHNA